MMHEHTTQIGVYPYADGSVRNIPELPLGVRHIWLFTCGLYSEFLYAGAGNV
jgi:hypothetical protein